MSVKFQTLTGMRDILPDEQVYFKRVQKSVESITNYYRFKRLDTPVLEFAEIFAKGTGVSTDIVQKEMYSFKTRGGDLVAIRPEFTPGIVRSYIENGMHSWPQPVKLWTSGPCFRYERPQAGRYRQMTQFDIEAIGEKNALIDGQIIQMSYDILKDLSFKDIAVEVNSIGDSECRPRFKKMLISYFKNRRGGLCADCQRRLKENPLRILDCKEEKCQKVKMGAPQMIDHLCEFCHNHFKQVLEFLDELELPYSLNPYLVRGLDYYTRTVFEVSDKSELGLAQGTLIGGGRYDGLVKLLGGRETPACGAAGGMERIVALLKEKEKNQKPTAKSKGKKEETPEIFLAQLGQLAKRKSLKLFEEFRAAKIPMAESFAKDSLRSQLSVANKMGVKWVLIFGQKEALEDFITLRNMETGVQTEVKLNKVVEEMKSKIE